MFDETNSPDKRKLEQVRALIDARRYEEARAMLITMDHPTADKWLDKVNFILAQQ